MLETSELARLVVALVVLPFILVIGRQLRTSGGGVYYLWCTLAVYVGLIATVLEDFWFTDAFNLLQHIALGLAGIFALLSALYTRGERATEQDDM